MFRKIIATINLVVIVFALFEVLLVSPQIALAAELFASDFEDGATLAASGFENIVDCENQSGEGLGGSTWGVRGIAAGTASQKYYCEARLDVTPTGREFVIEADFDHADAGYSRFGYSALAMGYAPAGFPNYFLDLYHGVGAVNPDRDLLELYLSEEDDSLVWTSDPGTIIPGTTQNIRLEGTVSTIAGWEVQPDGEVEIYVDDVLVGSVTNKKIGYVWDSENGIAIWDKLLVGPMGRMDNLSVSDGFEEVGPTLSAPTATVTPSPSRLLLEWTAVDNAESYEIQMCDGVGCVDYSNYGTFSNEFEDLTNGVPGTVYRFRIRAIDTGGVYATSEWYEFEGVPDAGLPEEAEYYEFNAGSIIRFTPSSDIAGAPSQTAFVLYGPTVSSDTSIVEWVRLTAAIDDGDPTPSELADWQASGTYPSDFSASNGPGDGYAHYNWRTRYDPTQLAGDKVYRGLPDPYTTLVAPFYEVGERPGYGVVPEWMFEINGRSATYDPVTNAYLGDGELRIDITGDEIDGEQNMINVSDLDWNWHPDNRRFRVGWGVVAELYEVWFSARRVLPTGPEDPYLVAYHDFDETFEPVDSIYDGLVYYDPTFNRVDGEDYTSVANQVGNALVDDYGGTQNVYEGVGIDFLYPVVPSESNVPDNNNGGGGGGGGVGGTGTSVIPTPTPTITPTPVINSNPPQVTITQVEAPLPRTGVYFSFIPGVWFMYAVYKMGETHWRRIRAYYAAAKVVNINFHRFEYTFG